MGEVVKLDTPEKRATAVRAHLAKTEQTVKIVTVQDALKWGAGWQAYAERLETLLAISEIHKRSSELLLEFAEDELLRLRGKA